jgi:hypothetical protein
MAIPLRAVFDAHMVLAATVRSKDGTEAIRLFALAAIYHGALAAAIALFIILSMPAKADPSNGLACFCGGCIPLDDMGDETCNEIPDCSGPTNPSCNDWCINRGDEYGLVERDTDGACGKNSDKHYLRSYSKPRMRLVQPPN